MLEKGYEVHGLIRRSSTFNTSRIEHLFKDPHESDLNFHLHYGDLVDGSLITNLLHEVSPDEIYNLGAQSHVQVSFKMPYYTASVDGMGPMFLLETMRSMGLNARFYQASTSELFGTTPPPQNESSAFKPRSPYGAAKLMAYWNTVNYRDGYGLHASNGILFNHESPRRGETFVTRKIARAVAAIAAGRQEKLYLGNLDAVRDWGYAKEYVETMWLMLQQEKPGDYVVATGIGATVRDFVSEAFNFAGLEWQKYVEVDSRYTRPTEVDALIGDPSKAESELKWKAKVKWKELSHLMVEAELKRI